MLRTVTRAFLILLIADQGVAGNDFIRIPRTAVIGGRNHQSPVKLFAVWDACSPVITEKDVTPGARQCISSHTERGIRYFSYHPLSSVEVGPSGYAGLAAAYPDLARRGFLRRFDGKPSAPPGPEGIPRGYMAFSNSSDAWLDFMLGVLKTQSDAGMSGVLFDEGWGTLGPGAGPDFSDGSMRGFRQYLQGRYARGELLAKGILDVTTFNWWEELQRTKVFTASEGNFSRAWWNEQLERPLRAGEIYTSKTFEIAYMWQADDPLVALMGESGAGDFGYYNRLRLREIYSKLRQELKAYAVKGGRQWLLGGNVYNGLGWGNAAVGAVVMDLPVGELSYREEGWPRRNFTPFFKNMAALGKRFCPMLWPGQVLHPRQKPDTESFLLFVADLYASGGISQYPDSPIADPFYLLIQAHEEFFSETDNRVALYYSLGNHMGDVGRRSVGVRTYYGAARLLEDSHHSYDVLYQGDPDMGPGTVRWVEKRSTMDDLKKYKVIVLPETRYQSDEEVRNFLAYVQGGGILVVFGAAGTHDFRLQPRRHSEWRKLVDRGGTQTFGAGKVLVFPRIEYTNLAESYDAELAASDLAVFTGELDKIRAPDIVTELDRDVHVHRFRDSERGIEVLHLINFKYDLKSDRVISTNGKGFAFAPSGVYSRPRVTYYTPGAPRGTELGVSKLESGRLEITLPTLHVYGVMVLGEKRQE